MHRRGHGGVSLLGAGRRACLRGLRAFLLGGLGALATACSPTEGFVEIAWALIDQGGTPIYPDGELSDSCELVGLRDGESAVAARLRFVLEVCDPECGGGCDDPECQVIEPTSFACNTARGALRVPSGAADYRFEARVIAELDGDPACTCTLNTACAQLPGPRERRVRGAGYS